MCSTSPSPVPPVRRGRGSSPVRSTATASGCVLSRRARGPISRPPRACAREAETIAPAHSSRTAATGPDYGSAGRPPHIFGVPGPPAPILAPVSLMSEKSKRNLVKPRSRPFRSGWSPPSAGLSGSRGFSRAAIRACRRLRPEVGREGDHGVRLSATSGLGRWFLPRARTRESDGKLDLSQPQSALNEAVMAEDWSRAEALITDDIVRRHAASGRPEQMRQRFAAYQAAGLDEIVVAGAHDAMQITQIMRAA
jgi:hypothetical protein